LFLAKRENLLFFIVRSSIIYRENIQYMTRSFMSLFAF
jgi:hypothetical protein